MLQCVQGGTQEGQLKVTDDQPSTTSRKDQPSNSRSIGFAAASSNLAPFLVLYKDFIIIMYLLFLKH